MGNSVVLYHGSKNGLAGNIRPISRELCDFGKGFYMGAERDTLRQESERLRQEGIRKAEEIYRKHRRDGLFFDEIISGGYNQNA